MLGICRPVIHQAAETGYSIVFAVKRIVAHKAPVFGHEKKEKTINQAQELAVKLLRKEGFGAFGGKVYTAPEVFIGRMGEKPVCQALQAFFNAIA
jgi:hypothetical protein